MRNKQDDPPAAICTNLRKTFNGHTVVNDVSFSIAPGEVYGLLGPNGAGKTTVISMMCGVLPRDAGDISIGGININEGPQARAQIGYVPQEIALYHHLSAQENLNFWAGMYNIPRSETAKRITTTLDLVGLTNRASDRVDEYSGGMQRRLNIAVGLLHQPRLLILDEPTVGVDPQSRNTIMAGVETLHQEGLAVLYTTHYMEEAERLCDRIGIMDEGRLIAEGTRQELVTLTGDDDRIELSFRSTPAGTSANTSEPENSAPRKNPGHDRQKATSQSPQEGSSRFLEKAAQVARETPGTHSAGVTAEGAQVFAKNGRQVLPRLLENLVDAGCPVDGVTVHEPDLEAVFLHLTGKGLRD